jgi:hypothetical protein
MHVAEAVVYASGLLGCVSGAASGARHSLVLGIGGAVAGLDLGVVSFFALAFPYVWCFTRVEMPGRLFSMSRLGKWLFLPVMAVILLAAALGSWFAVGLLV